MVAARVSFFGLRTDRVTQKFRTGMPVRFEMAEGAAEYAAVIADVDPNGRSPGAIERILIREEE